MSIERDELARDIYVACAAVRLTPREAFEAADAFLRERQARQVQPKVEPAPVAATEAHDFDPLACPPIAGDFHGPHGSFPRWDGTITITQSAPSPSPQWGRASVLGGGPGSSYVWHRWLGAESTCGERADGAVTLGTPEAEQRCNDCHMSETGEVQTEEPALHLDGTQTAQDIAASERVVAADGTVVKDRNAALPAKPRRPRDTRCVVPGCGRAGPYTANAHGAKVGRGVRTCDAHDHLLDEQPAQLRKWAGERERARKAVAP